MPMDDGARHAATNVDLSASDADAPCCLAASKCARRIVLAGAVRASFDVSAITVETKSAIAASGCDDDHFFAFGCCALALASMTMPATASQMFSSPAR